MAQFSYIDLHTNVNPEQIWPQKPKIIPDSLICLIGLLKCLQKCQLKDTIRNAVSIFECSVVDVGLLLLWLFSHL